MLALKRLPTTSAALSLYFLCLALVLIPAIVVLTIDRRHRSGAKLGNLLTLLVVFGAAPRILLAPALAMDERLGPWALLKATWRATHGQHRRLLGFFLIFLAASLILVMAVSR